VGGCGYRKEDGGWERGQEGGSDGKGNHIISVTEHRVAIMALLAR
jgi:hypothetical protein